MTGTRRTSSTSRTLVSRVRSPTGQAGCGEGPQARVVFIRTGRIFKMVLDPDDPLTVQSLSVLIDQDPLGYDNPAAFHQPDNIETTANSVLIQEDPGTHNQGPVNGYAKVWRYTLPAGPPVEVAQVNQSLRPDLPIGSWESSGIIDASSAFGPGCSSSTSRRTVTRSRRLRARSQASRICEKQGSCFC